MATESRSNWTWREGQGFVLKARVGDGGRIIPVIPDVDPAQAHTHDRPFCGDEGCPCHGDFPRWWDYIGVYIVAGLLTPYEASLIFMNRQV